ncbi:hypothetical protein C7M84_021339 [Penaeus vannamei]|uniref:Uncharacterized protein n=1 Tax=Penaeus vannamei TaxID=6689 RepID=A0A3R7NEK6_PENVA|nr:hypothetical protein C7M84_021339 [Penaeus vannamei]
MTANSTNSGGRNARPRPLGVRTVLCFASWPQQTDLWWGPRPLFLVQWSRPPDRSLCLVSWPPTDLFLVSWPRRQKWPPTDPLVSWPDRPDLSCGPRPIYGTDLLFSSSRGPDRPNLLSVAPDRLSCLVARQTRPFLSCGSLLVSWPRQTRPFLSCGPRPRWHRPTLLLLVAPTDQTSLVVAPTEFVARQPFLSRLVSWPRQTRPFLSCGPDRSGTDLLLSSRAPTDQTSLVRGPDRSRGPDRPDLSCPVAPDRSLLSRGPDRPDLSCPVAPVVAPTDQTFLVLWPPTDPYGTDLLFSSSRGPDRPDLSCPVAPTDLSCLVAPTDLSCLVAPDRPDLSYRGGPEGTDDLLSFLVSWPWTRPIPMAPTYSSRLLVAPDRPDLSCPVAPTELVSCPVAPTDLSCLVAPTDQTFLVLWPPTDLSCLVAPTDQTFFLLDLLQKGASEPWKKQLGDFLGTGNGNMDASALLDYFQPLDDFLTKFLSDNDITPGWRQGQVESYTLDERVEIPATTPGENIELGQQKTDL